MRCGGIEVAEFGVMVLAAGADECMPLTLADITCRSAELGGGHFMPRSLCIISAYADIPSGAGAHGIARHQCIYRKI